MKTLKNARTNCAAFVCILVFALFSCTANSPQQQDDKKDEDKTGGDGISETANEENKEIGDGLPERDFGGYAFRLYLQENYYEDMYIAEESGDIADDAVYKRNKAVEERFNIDIVPVYYPQDWSSGMDGAKAIQAGEDAFDLMFTHGIIAYMYAGQGLAIDWMADMPFVDFSRQWWNQDVIGDSAMFGKLYCPAGDISYTGLRNTSCMIFNKDLFQSLGVEYPYADVVDGEWTLDKFVSIVKNGAADLNGDGKMSPEADRYGLESHGIFSFPAYIFYVGGDRVIKKDENGIPFLSIYNERTVDIIDKFFDVLNSGTACVRGDNHDIWGNPDRIPVFDDGRALLFNTTLGTLIAMREMGDEIGIVPMPKYDRNMPKYYALVEANARMAMAPVTAEDLERTSIIAEALCSEGYKTVIPAYYEKALKIKFARDDESAEMLDYIKDSAVYDYGYMNSSLTGDLNLVGTNLMQARNTNFASFYEKNAPAVQKNLEAFIEKMSNS
ncbi:MAG: extracellular solute-binding protein [Oscillospiraceae bacterium]|nr:extracellular solute-binding protein [Oscillospiraceae bacterium]